MPNSLPLICHSTEMYEKGTLSQIFSGEYREIYKNIYFEELEAAMRGVAQEKMFFQISQNSQETPGSRVSI